MRIFLGFSEVANFIQTYKKGFELNGWQTYTVVSHRNKYYSNADYDVVLLDLCKVWSHFPSVVKRLLVSFLIRFHTYRAFIYALITCDVFFYNTGGNILPFELDYRLIRLLRKKLVIIFLGSEIRHWYVYQLEMERLGYSELFKTGIEAYKNQRFGTYSSMLRRVKNAERFANLILSHPSYGQLQTRPYMRGRIGLEVSTIKWNIPNNDIPIIVHAPSSRSVKGTEFVIECINKIKQEGIEVDFRLVEDISNECLLDLLYESDIVIDELNSDSIGVLSTEAMATGNAVLTSYLPEYFDFKNNCPVLNSNKETLLANLRNVIVNREYRMELAREGRKYVIEHNDLKRVTAKIVEWCFRVSPLEYDVVPEINNSFSMPEHITEVERNF